METRAHFVLIGAFTLIVLVGIFGLVLFFSGQGAVASRKTYEIVFSGSVAGLSRGSAVLFNGLKVGEVASMSFVANDPGRVAAFVQVESQAPIRADTKARLETQGLAGGAVIALAGGAPGAPDLPRGPHGEPPVLQGEPSELQSILENVASLSSRADALLAKADRLLSDNTAAVNDIVGNADRFSKALGDNASGVNAALASVSKLGETIGPLADHLGKLADAADKDLAALDPDKVRAIVNDISEFTNALAQDKDAVKSALADAASLAKRLNDASAELGSTVDAIDKIATAIDPDKVGKLVESAQKTFAAVDPAKVAAIVSDVSQFTGAIAADKGLVSGLIADAGSFAKRLNEASAKFGGTIDDIDALAKAVDAAKISRIVDGADKAIGALDADKLRSIVADASEFADVLSQNKEAVKSLLADAASLAKRLNDASDKLGGTITDIDAVAKAVDGEKLAHLMDGAEALGDALSENRDNMSKTIKNASELTAKLNGSADKLNGMMSSLEGIVGSPNVKGPLAQFSDAAKSVRQLADDADQRVKEVSAGLVRFSGSGLKEYEGLAVDGRRTVNDLDRLLRSLGEEPEPDSLGRERLDGALAMPPTSWRCIG